MFGEASGIALKISTTSPIQGRMILSNILNKFSLREEKLRNKVFSSRKGSRRRFSSFL